MQIPPSSDDLIIENLDGTALDGDETPGWCFVQTPRAAHTSCAALTRCTAQ